MFYDLLSQPAIFFDRFRLQSSSPHPLSSATDLVSNLTTFSYEPQSESGTSSTGLDEPIDTTTLGPVISTKASANYGGSNHVRITRQSAKYQARVITDEPPNSHFDFMRLPNNVKHGIYLLLMGNRDIYLTINESKDDRNVLRMQEITAAFLIELSPFYSFPVDFRQAGRTLVAHRLSNNVRVSLCILRVSHQVYDEGHLLPYKHNTFNIDMRFFKHFVDVRTSHQKQSLRSLGLKIDMSGPNTSMNLKNSMFRDSSSLTDLTQWTEALKIWGTRRLGSVAEVVFSDFLNPYNSFSEFERKQVRDISRIVSAELSNRDMVEEHRKVATNMFSQLPKDLRMCLLRDFDKLKAENISGWLPGCSETMD